jgi:predicted transglutaminase-like cysteine proteinase
MKYANIKSVLNPILCLILFQTLYAGAMEHSSLQQKRVEAYKKFLSKIKDIEEDKKLILTNNYFNQIVSEYDSWVWKKRDYWAAPLEFIKKGAGDCEDYAIAKYYTLKKVGIDANRLFLMVVKTEKKEEYHMVLGYFKDFKHSPLILDNLSWKILTLKKRKDLKFIIGFNEKYILKNRKISSLNLSKYYKYSEINRWIKFLKK